MNRDATRRPRSLGELVAQTQIPRNAVGLFWPGGESMVFKSVRQRIYLVDPSQASWAGASGTGVIDIRPDLVFCSLGSGPDLPTVTHLATAFPDARFVGSGESRNQMIGRQGDLESDGVPVDPGRVHALEHDMRLDVRQVGVADGVRIRVLNDGGHVPGWNVLLSFAGLQICLIRTVDDRMTPSAIAGAIRRRVDVLLWSMQAGSLEAAGALLDALRPGYAIPIGYDRIPNGRDQARRFRDLAARVPGVKTYLFSDDYMEGLLYSRIMSRKRRFS